MKRSLCAATVVAAFAATCLLPIAYAEEQKELRCVDRLKVVKAAVDKAPAGSRKNAAQTQYILALKSYQGLGREKWKRTQERKCLLHLDNATAALKE